MTFDPTKYHYDYGLGIEPSLIDYIKESHVVQSRVSPTPCYLLQLNPTGSLVGSEISAIEITTYVDTSPNYKAVIWDGGSNHPDIRFKTEEGEDAITLLIDSVPAIRMHDIEDLENDNEYCIVQREDLDPKRIEIVFNEGFDASGHTVSYYFYTMNKGVSNIRLKEAEDDSSSMHGWTQYLNTSCDDYQGKHQILVRLPLATRDLTVSAEGLVVLEEKEAWMIWSPYTREQDVLIIPQEHSFTGHEERFEIVDKKDSIIQRTLVSQRFKLKHIEHADKRYLLTYVTT